MKRQIISVLLIFSLIVVLGGCGQNEQATNDGEKLKVAMICSEGGLGDRSYNDSAYNGLQKAEKELDMEIRAVEPEDISEGEKYLTELARSGYDLIITLEIGHADVLENVADQFPDTRFAIFNTTVDKPNVTSVIFKEHEGSFLAGALAAMVTKDSEIKGINDEKIIGFIGGIDSPGINKFLVGYEEGAHVIDSDIKIISGYTNSFADPGKGKEMALTQIEQGADIIYQVAGGTGEGVINAAKEKGVFAIGVDSDQDGIAPGNVLTSMLKRADRAVYNLCTALNEGTLQETDVMALGLKEGGVELSEMKYTRDMIPAEYLEKIKELKLDVSSGGINVTDITN